MKALVGGFHKRVIARRRESILAKEIAMVLPSHAKILDVGCGNGSISAAVMRLKPGVQVHGLETRTLRGCEIHCQNYDGLKFPLETKSVDGCIFVDVLHHTDDSRAVLQEAIRVSRRFILIKDHFCENKLSFCLLRVMDYFGNLSNGSDSPEHHYHSRAEWRSLWHELGLKVSHLFEDLKLYRGPGNSFLNQSLHFVAKMHIV